MTGSKLGVAATFALTFYIIFGLMLLAASFVGVRSGLAAWVIYLLLGVAFYALEKLFPATFSDETAGGPRLTAGRVAVFLLWLALLIAGFIMALMTAWGSAHVGLVIVTLLAGQLFLLFVLERRWSARDGRR